MDNKGWSPTPSTHIPVIVVQYLVVSGKSGSPKTVRSCLSLTKVRFDSTLGLIPELFNPPRITKDSNGRCSCPFSNELTFPINVVQELRLDQFQIVSQTVAMLWMHFASGESLFLVCSHTNFISKIAETPRSVIMKHSSSRLTKKFTSKTVILFYCTILWNSSWMFLEDVAM